MNLRRMNTLELVIMKSIRGHTLLKKVTVPYTSRKSNQCNPDASTRAVRFNTAVRDYNETRASDVYVVNFGAHYRPYKDEEFKEGIFALLDDMAELGKTATVIWR